MFDYWVKNNTKSAPQQVAFCVIYLDVWAEMCNFGLIIHSKT